MTTMPACARKIEPVHTLVVHVVVGCTLRSHWATGWSACPSRSPLPPGTTVQVKLAPASVEIWHQGRRVGRHACSYDRHQEILDLEHYLDVLEHKPGAFAGSKPLEQWRRAGRCDGPDCPGG